MIIQSSRRTKSGSPFEGGGATERQRIEALSSLDGAFRRSFWELFYFGEAIAGALFVVAACLYSSIGYLRLHDPSQRPFAWILIAHSCCILCIPGMGRTAAPYVLRIRSR